jgi:uncharacterized protein (TIGR03435 family)
MESDAKLLRQYVRDNDDAAFTELVSRHINLVYSTACRETGGDAALAQDVTQLVFIELARKSSRLTQHTALGAWLYTSVRHVSANLRRAQQRRTAREQKAQTMKESPASQMPDSGMENLDGVLDDALHELNERDRGAVVLRFLEGNNLRDVGAALGLSEDAARMRVDRALEKLRTLLAKRGVTSTASGLTAALVATTLTAPSSLAAASTTIAGVAIKGVTATSSTTAVVEMVMGWMKLKTTLVMAASLFAAGTTTAIIIQRNHAQNTPSPTAVLDESMWTTDTLSQLPPLLIIRPTKFNGAAGINLKTSPGISQGSRKRWRADSMKHLIAFAYGIDQHQVVLSTPLPEGKYDWLVTVPDPLGALRREIKQQFNLVGRRDKGVVDVLLLQAKATNAPGLKRVEGFVIGTAAMKPNRLEIKGRDINYLASMLADMFKQPVINRTGMAGRFDMTLQLEYQPDRLAAMNAAVDPLGLELVPSREEIDLLMVEFAR